MARLLHRQNSMKPRGKLGLVIAGYVLAAAVAAAVVACHLAVIGGPSSPGYGGMNAFGDTLLFLAAFGVAAIPATGAALFFLRPHAGFWRGYSIAALVFALTSLAAFLMVVIDPRSLMAGLAFPRILVAPLFTLAFLLSGGFAPARAARIKLFAAAATEITGFLCWVATCLLRNF